MGFLTEMAGCVPDNIFLKDIEKACTLPDFFKFWRDNLFERLMRLFIWEGTGELEPKEIEERVLMAGHCGIAKYKGKPTAFFGSFFGVTVYQDEWTGYTVHSPIYSNTFKIDKNIAIINNNSLRNPSLEHVNHYAKLLAHADVTLMLQMVQARDAGGVPVAQNQKAKESLLQYQKDVYNGKITTVSDLAGIGVNFLGADRHTNLDINSVWDVRTKLLKAFYADIGVRATFDKRSNAVVDEITSDSSMLLYNVSDMLEERKKGAEKVNKLFGTNWSVRLSDQINYTTENEPEEIKAAEEKREEVTQDANE